MLIETFGKLIARKFVKLLVSTESQSFSGVFTSSLVIPFLCIRAKEKTDACNEQKLSLKLQEKRERKNHSIISVCFGRKIYFTAFHFVGQFGFMAVLYY